MKSKMAFVTNLFIKKEDKSLLLWLFISLAICFLIQLAGIAVLEPIAYDSKEYLSISGNLFHNYEYAITGTFEGFESFEGETPTRMRQPGYPIYLILFYWLSGESIRVLQFSQVILNLFTFYLMFLIAKKTFKEKLWAGTLIGLALYFPLWFTSAFALTDCLFTFLLVLAMFFLQRALYSAKIIRLYALSGAVFGLAFLTRPIGLLLGLLSIFPIWLYLKKKEVLRLWGVLLISFCVIIFPWFLRNAIVMGDYTPLSSIGGYGFWVATLEDEKLASFDSPKFLSIVQDDHYHGLKANSRFTDAAIMNVKKEPVRYFVRGVKRLLWVWSYFPGSRIYRDNFIVFSLFSLIQAVLLFSALFCMFTISDKKLVGYYLFPALSLLCPIIFYLAISRFLIPAMPFILVFAGQGFWSLGQRLNNALPLSGSNVFK